jgi:hypothetical protein
LIEQDDVYDPEYDDCRWDGNRIEATKTLLFHEEIAKRENRHDKQRREKLIQTLQKAKEQAETAVLYLTANNRNMDDIFNARLALEHIEIALEHLGVTAEV